MEISSFNDLASIIFMELGRLIAGHEGLEVFAAERARFEGWVKVELIGILKKYFNNVIPEASGIDVVADDWAIEIKTVNTNYRYPGVKNKTRPITSNIKGVLKDIEKLKKIKFKNKLILFIVFPLPSNSLKWWKRHLAKIQRRVKEIKSHEAAFRNGIPLKIYLAYI